MSKNTTRAILQQAEPTRHPPSAHFTIQHLIHVTEDDVDVAHPFAVILSIALLEHDERSIRGRRFFVPSRSSNEGTGETVRG
jgi:hypothetical protein